MFKKISSLFCALFLLSASSLSASTQLRVLHLSPDAPAVDIWVDGSVALSDVPFQGVSDYLEIEAGEYRIQVTPTGETEPVVIDATVNLDDNTTYSVAATGLLADESISPLVIVDNTENESGLAKVRFSHTSPDAPPVDVALQGGDVLFPNRAFGETSDYISVPEGTYDLEVRLAGTPDVVLNLPGVALSAQTNYHVFAIGLVGDTTLAALPTVISEAGPAEVRVAHLSPDAPSVDVWVDGEIALANVPFKTVSEYLNLSKGEHQIQVTPTGETEPVVIDAVVNLDGDTAYTVAATGLLSENDLQPTIFVDDRTPVEGKAKVRVIHTSPDAPAVDINVANGPTIISDLEFRSASETLILDSGVVHLEVRVSENSALALEVPGVELEAGKILTVFAVGTLAEETLSVLPVFDFEEQFVRADANGDFSVNISDPIFTLRYLFLGLSNDEVICGDAADSNDNGHIQISDAIYTLTYLFLGGSEPPSPFPMAGADPTGDALRCKS